MNTNSKFYVEKRRTLGLYHIVHQENCPILPDAIYEIEEDDSKTFEGDLTTLSERFGSVKKCQVCFNKSSDS